MLSICVISWPKMKIHYYYLSEITLIKILLLKVFKSFLFSFSMLTWTGHCFLKPWPQPPRVPVTTKKSTQDWKMIFKDKKKIHTQSNKFMVRNSCRRYQHVVFENPKPIQIRDHNSKSKCESEVLLI